MTCASVWVLKGGSGERGCGLISGSSRALARALALMHMHKRARRTCSRPPKLERPPALHARTARPHTRTQAQSTSFRLKVQPTPQIEHTFLS
eukprot:4114047-Pleurochrysis_carterae.AAC.3